MCGICGVVTKRRGAVAAGRPETHTALLYRMASVMTHRGPDDAGFLLAGGPEGGRRLHVAGVEDLPLHAGRALHDPRPFEVGLGMRRLAIVDPAGGHQPIGNEDGTIWLVFGGEIYNHRELRAHLERRGHRFATASDGEAIVHAYEEYGPDCVRHLRGKFAFALWDDPRRFLLLARDRVGAKPLFVAEVADRFLFASEIKALLQDPGLRRAAHPEALYHYVTYGYVPAPQTMFRGIYQLPPGHLLAWRDGEPTVEEYWEGPEALLAASGGSRRDPSPGSAAPRVAWESVRAAVAARLTSDLPGPTRGCGVFLDGSLASAAVAAAMREALDAPVPSFAVGLAGRDPSLARSRRIARHVRTDHHEIVLSPDAEALWPRVIRQLDEPLADPAALPQFLLSQAAREHVTVALSPLGASLLAVPHSSLSDRINRISRIFSGRIGRGLIHPVHPVHPVRETALHPSVVPGHGLFTGSLKRALFAAESEDRFPSSLGLAEPLFERVAHCTPADQAAYLALKSVLPGSSLLLADRLGMAFGLETREPFLDADLLDVAFSLAPSRNSLRGALAGHLPASLLSLPAALPLQIGDDHASRGARLRIWDRGPVFQSAMEAALSTEAVRARGYFSPEAVQAMFREQKSGRARRERQLWALFALEIWHRIYLDHDYSTRADLTFEDLGLAPFGRDGAVKTDGATARRGRSSASEGAAAGYPTTAPTEEATGAGRGAAKKQDLPSRPVAESAPSPKEGRPLSILMAAEDDPTLVTGGASRLLREWSTRLAARGHAVTVLARRAGAEQPTRETWGEVELVRYATTAGHSVGRLNATLREGARALRRLQVDHAFDVITVHHPLIGCAIRRAAARGAGTAGAPARLYAFHAPWADVSREVRSEVRRAGCGVRSAGRWNSAPRTPHPARERSDVVARCSYLAKRELERTAIDSCDDVLVPSRYSAEKLHACHSVPETRVRRVPGGVDTERFRPRADRRALRRRLGLSESAFLILTVRPLTPMAGLEQLITAMSGITAVFPEAHLVIGGCPHPESARYAPLPAWEAALRRQVTGQGLEDDVTFAGFIPELLLPEYYAMADLFVMPSQCLEPFGLAAVEALACGTPVFGTPVGGLPEILADLDPAALFAGTGAAQIADRIIRHLPDLHHDTTRRRRCRQFALEHYSWDVVLPALEALFVDAATRRHQAVLGAGCSVLGKGSPRRWALGPG